MRPASIPPIDWRSHDQFSEHSLTCVCGAVFRSHSKAVMLDGGWSIQSRKACPAVRTPCEVLEATWRS